MRYRGRHKQHQTIQTLQSKQQTARLHSIPQYAAQSSSSNHVYGNFRLHHTYEIPSRASDHSNSQHNTYIGSPPPPPTRLNAHIASDPQTHSLVLWHIAEHLPHLRKWIIANPSAEPELLEYIAQHPGPGVQQAFAVLFDEQDQTHKQQHNKQLHDERQHDEH